MLSQRFTLYISSLSNSWFFISVSLIVLVTSRDPIYSTNGTLSGDDLRLADSRIKDCVVNCPTVRSLLVVCGTDNKSYVNKGRVACVDQCLKPFGESEYSVVFFRNSRVEESGEVKLFETLVEHTEYWIYFSIPGVKVAYDGFCPDDVPPEERV